MCSPSPSYAPMHNIDNYFIDELAEICTDTATTSSQFRHQIHIILHKYSKIIIIGEDEIDENNRTE